MYIEEVVIEGFKSYAKRTVIKGFDRWFNAITGLNGSGKSNILDAICFVLGISNLSQVRASSLQDLVYKQGQAGVSKATVTVVFNNRDASRSPVGYERCETLSVTREVVVGGRNRYLVNGRNAQASQVANLFHSVQLNVNNPHFLIMQGRITKVLNMKPVEVLGMVEEAAGTRMFESKKQAALKTLEKKESKVGEIERVLADDIAPTLERLRAEKARYLRWSANAAAVARLERFCVAYEFDQVSKTFEAATSQSDAAKAEADRAARRAVEAIGEAEALEADMARASSDADGGGDPDLREALRDAEREVIKALAAAKATRQALARDEDAASKAQAQKVQDEARRAQALKAAAEAKEAFERLSVAETEAKDAFERAAEKHRAAEAGTSAADGNGSQSLETRLGAAKETLAGAEAALARSTREETALISQRDGHRAAAKRHADERSRLCEARKRAEASFAEAKAKFDGLVASDVPGLGDDEEATDDASLSTRVRKAFDDVALAKKALREQARKVETLEAEVEARLAVDFDSSKVDATKIRGRLARLVYPTNPRYGAALEVVAGSRLYHVVVDDEGAGKQLLERGRLRQRTTIIPLNTISSRPLPADKVAAAKALAATTAPAVDLVGYEPEAARAAVQFAFGSTLVCENLDDAKRVAFDKAVKTKCVTLQGDVCNPVGTLTGGSAPSASLGLLLTKLFALREARVEEARLEDAYDDLSRRAQALEARTRERRALASALEIAKARADDAREAEAACAATVAESALETVDADLAKIKSTAEGLRGTVAAARKDIWQLEKTGADVQEQYEAMLELQREDAERCRRARAEAAAERNKAEMALKDLQAEAEDLAAGGAAGIVFSDLAVARAALEEATAVLEQKTAAKAEVQARVDDDDRRRKDRARASRAQRQKVEGLRAAANDADLEAKRCGRQASASAKDARDADLRRADLEKEHAWIAAERQFFGRPGSDYDFRGDVAAVKRDLEKLAAEQDELARSINQRVMGAIEHAEREYDDLTAKREAVKRDRQKIQAVIAELDDKKKDTLETTVAKVDKDFGAIFATLLPGARAKLVPPDDSNGDVLKGLEFKVAFGDIWKQSLTELSGGQRSLVALSLVLAMLKFKPAPMYILDEVDAALDLSHTQNIGNMLKRHFQDAQFLVVSLKEGMFNNANVLFRTKFIDGLSAVSRTVNLQEEDHAGGENTNHSSSNTNTKHAAPPAKRPKTKRLAAS